jgi:hypothetical protein
MEKADLNLVAKAESETLADLNHHSKTTPISRKKTNVLGMKDWNFPLPSVESNARTLLKVG